MLPATLAQDVKRQIRHYLEATFNFRRRDEEAALSAFVNDPENGLFKGPWVQLRLPFRPAADTYDAATLFDVIPSFHPFRHQWQAWQRLSSKGREPESTIVTTGTGSGKTECFLFPLLDHCLRAAKLGEKGVKAIILYPMNALAADQAGRFAEEVFSRPELHQGAGDARKARVRIGLYTGRSNPAEGGAADDTAVKEMRATCDAYFHITDHEAMQEDPPDILLTNYKMLDYLLLRPKDQRIWRFNEPGRLRFLVLDELHTYDGAQGADVACLVRRIKARLDVAEGGLCCIGTSATIAGGQEEETMDPLERLSEFASILFQESFKPGMIVNEEGNRLDVAEMVVPAKDRESLDVLPSVTDCLPRDAETAEVFAQRIATLWGAPAFPLAAADRWRSAEVHKPSEEKFWGLALGEWLRKQEFFKALLDLTRTPVLTWDQLVSGVADRFYTLREVKDPVSRGQVVEAYFALVAQALDLRSKRALPMVPTHVQVWVRELRRLGRYVENLPKFGWIDEKRPGSPILPVAHCSECGESVWVALTDPDADSQIRAKGVNGFRLIDDATKIYQGWGFERSSQSPNIVVISPWQADDDGPTDANQFQLPSSQWFLSPESLVVREGPGDCPLSGSRTFQVKLNRDTHQQENGRVVGRVRCPHCETRGSLMFIGSRAATISSVAIDEMFGSVLNSDPKLLAFTDSVQDASHRAGFFSARTYHFTFRTALQRIIDEAGAAGVPLNEVGDRLLDYWSVDAPGRPGGPLEALATLVPPDLRQYPPYIAFREKAGKTTPIPRPLRDDIAKRLTWEAISEFGLMLTHGRTLELNGSSCVDWDQDVIDRVAERLLSRLPGIDIALEGISARQLKLWILGLLQRQRARGGIAHDYVAAFARSGLWGKKSYKRVVEGRETFPLHGRFTPRLLVTGNDRKHDHALSVPRRGAQDPWNTVWARRALAHGSKGLQAVSDVAIVDLIRAFLIEGSAEGLLTLLHREGDKNYYAISSGAARLRSDGRQLACDHSGHLLLRQETEAGLWADAPSLAYASRYGRYRDATFTERQNYYRRRYRKGALRRVFAQEHTGLLTTQEREDLERRFNGGLHADDPNVLTATSTLEMGIDIGDLSTTMLCSVPPTTASYLQRIGRAGRTTGTALVVSVINQRPHDLFFFARPEEMLAGKIEPPGCWLDASAMLVRQYLAYGFDSAVKDKVISHLPASGKQLEAELEANSGPIVDLLNWMTVNEAALQEGFLGRFGDEVRPDTRNRFRAESQSERLKGRIRAASTEFGDQIKNIDAARRRLTEQKKELADASDIVGLREVEREIRILRARALLLNRTSALEVLTEHGLLPNYAFPERGVRLTGAVYQDHQGEEDTPISIDITRAAAVAIRELAPRNVFYTHGHQFDIQQLSLGSQSQPLVHQWAVCGKCGHMRMAEEVQKPEAKPACPQCGYDKPQHSQLDRAQWKGFVNFAQSGAISYMEYYDSLSGDRAEERDQRYYRLVYSFDQTAGGIFGAVGTENEPFGLEFRSSLILRQVNTGLMETPQGFQFGVEQKVPELGFPVCRDCGIAADREVGLSDVEHRKSCAGRKRTDKAFREGRSENGYKWERIYLYRELKSEAIRLLLPPDVDAGDISTLRACLFLGLRLHFRGSPGHLLIEPQVLPDHKQDLRRHYLVIMDAVPGGTGFLKSLFEPKYAGEVPGGGIMTVLRLALDALQSCACRLIGPEEDDTDGCYRCIRAYRLQHQSEEISRELGIKLLQDMIAAGEKRTVIEALDDLNASSLFGSVLEKKFVDRLEAEVMDSGGEWQKALVKGTSGFRLRFGSETLVWEIQLQPKLGLAEGVTTACMPDFMLTADDATIRPIAVFTDGFEFHAHPGKPTSRLADDAVKRRAVINSGKYLAWSITWQDLLEGPAESLKLLNSKIQPVLERKMQAIGKTGLRYPDVDQAVGNGLQQLIAFLRSPFWMAGWQRLANEAGLIPVQVLANKGTKGATATDILALYDKWRSGGTVPDKSLDESNGHFLHTTILAEGGDLLIVADQGEVLASNSDKVLAHLRLDDSAEERASVSFLVRWRRWLSLSNLLQFSGNANWFTTSQVLLGSAPDLELAPTGSLPADWEDVIDSVLLSLISLARKMAHDGVPVPRTEHFLENASDECFAEMAWPLVARPTCLLVGDQANFADDWRRADWRVLSLNDVHGNGTRWLAGLLNDTEEYT